MSPKAILKVPNITPQFLMDRYSISEDLAERLIQGARRRYFRGMNYQEFKDGDGIAFLTWDFETSTAVFEIWETK